MVDMDWEFEELERQVALTAVACGREHSFSVNSITGSFDVVSLKRASQITVRAQGVKEEETSFELPRRALDRRREGRIISQPFALPPDPQDTSFLPPPSLQRSHTVPPPINTERLYRTSEESSTAPPIAFILQESQSPLPSTMHFTPSSVDLDAFPTTPRSFVSFAPDSRNSEECARPQPDLFLSSRLQNSYSSQTKMPLTPSPSTPYSLYSVSSQSSTPSLSAFPATPKSPFPSLSNHIRHPWGTDDKTIPPVPVLPPHKSACTLPASSEHSLNLDKPLPPLVTPESTHSYTPLPHKRLHTLPSSLAALPLPYCGDEELSESERSVRGHLSSRMSVLSSRFSLSSDDMGETIGTTGKRWEHIRSRTYSGGANSRAETHSRAKSHAEIHSRTNSHANSRARAHSRANSRAEIVSRANSRAETLSRATSRTETVSRGNCAGTLFRADSRGEWDSPTNSQPQMPSLVGSSPLFSTRSRTLQEQEQELPQSCSKTQAYSADSATPVRTLMKSMSRFSLGIKRTMSQGSQSKPSSKVHVPRRPSAHTSRVIVDENKEDGNEQRGGSSASGTPPDERRIAPRTAFTPASVPYLPTTPAVRSRSGLSKPPITSTSAVGSWC